MAVKHRLTCLILLSALTSRAFFTHAQTFDSDPIAALTSEYGEAIRQEVFVKLRLERPATLAELATHGSSIYKIPNWFHSQGTMHSVMYRHCRDGKSLLIKVILPDNAGYVSDEHFRREVYGMLLASHVGGPEISQAGRIVLPDGSTGYYVEMEELFALEPNTYTYKGFGSKSWPVRALSARSPNPAQLLALAKMIRLNLERRISIDAEPDLIFSGNNIRWIDTGNWSVWTSQIDIEQVGFSSQMALHNYGDFLARFLRLKRGAGIALVRYLKTEISNSPNWTSSQKAGLLANLRHVLVNHWQFPAKAFDSPGAQNLGKKLIKSCGQMLKGHSARPF